MSHLIAVLSRKEVVGVLVTAGIIAALFVNGQFQIYLETADLKSTAIRIFENEVPTTSAICAPDLKAKEMYVGQHSDQEKYKHLCHFAGTGR